MHSLRLEDRSYCFRRPDFEEPMKRAIEEADHACVNSQTKRITTDFAKYSKSTAGLDHFGLLLVFFLKNWVIESKESTIKVIIRIDGISGITGASG